MNDFSLWTDDEIRLAGLCIAFLLALVLIHTWPKSKY